MRYASIVVDIPTRALDGAFDYAVPDELQDCCLVGATVLVSFSHRMAVGYVVGVSDAPSAGLDPEKILSVEQVLAPPAFDEGAARVAAWMAKEYACPLPQALRLFLAPGQSIRVRRVNDAPDGADTAEGADGAASDAHGRAGRWELVRQQAGPVDERWVRLSAQAASFVPRSTASRQRQVIAALQAGPLRMSELAATLGSVSSAVSALEKRGVVEVAERRRIRTDEETTLSSAVARRPQQLTRGQEEALAAIERAREAAAGDVVLVDGVTGSGKTEVYLSAIERARAAGQGALVLVPEISLTAQTVGRFRSRFGDDVALLHSRLSQGERFDQWDLVRSGSCHVVVGARSALFAPLHDVGLIIIDEEHEASYKQGTAPRYHAREVAARLARERGCALVLGSATPSLESLARCAAGTWQGARWTRVVMPERPGRAVLPEVQVVDMAEQFRARNGSVFSKPLADALQEVAERQEKAVLLLNRRGFANFLMCRECGCVPECPHCSTALTYHERTHSLVCHTCGRSWPQRAYPDPSTRCPNCGSRYLAAYGVGTQRVEDELAMLLPEGVEVIRMDADTTRGKGAHQKLLERFDAARSAVLVGTQMIAKGLDFPEVTLVGVINADTTLKMPDFRAAERTYDLLEQVAGRAGRGDKPGRVIVQTYWATHPAIRAVAGQDRALFLESELAERKDGGYPPFSRLSNVLVWGRSEKDVADVSARLAAELRSALDGRPGWEVLGPADCLKARVKDQLRRHILVKSPPESSPGPLLGACCGSARVPKGINMAVDVDAYDMM